MVDERTREYLYHLKKALEVAGDVCTCADCINARMKKESSLCGKRKRIEQLPQKLIPDMPGNFIPELSPNYESFRLGRVRMLT
jgi:hypothetical protein